MMSTNKSTWFTDRNGMAGAMRKAKIAFLALAVLLPGATAHAAIVNPGPASCLNDDTGQSYSCTAKDVDIAKIELLQVFDGCTSTADTARITAVMDYVSGANERYDVGGFFAADGGTAKTGSCYHNYFAAPLAAAPNQKPKTGIGPFLNAETSVPADVCGDIRARDGVTRQSVDHFYGEEGSMQIACTDQDNNGYVDLGYCTFWDNNANSTCTGIATAIPGTASKCRCSRINLPIPVMPPPAVSTLGQLPSLTFADCSAAANNATLNLRLATGCTNLVINSVTNSAVGNVNGKGTCSFPSSLAANNEYTCSFPVQVTALTTYTTTVSAVCDGTPVTLTDSSTIDCYFSSPGCDSSLQCDDSLYCNGTETCTAGVCSASSGDPCSGGAACNNSCQEGTDTCFNSSGTACPDDGNACTTDTCNGSGTCSHPAGNAGATCRAADGVCDVAETCDGSSTSCPANNYVSASTVCRASAGVCDLAENCTGSSAACPAETWVSSSTVCRASAGVCDAAETCTGSSAACPADGKSTAVCRASASVCDAAETCDGVSNSCPADAFASASTVCRASAGVCDVAENCTGSSGTCPADAKSTAQCRASAGVCDTAETCDGVSNSCPADGFLSASTVCRASGGVCDVAENCTGSSASCPADAKSSAQCRASAGVCDVAETCDGVSNNCPADGKSSAQCRASAGVCDAAETCDGVSNNCPADVFESSFTVCRASGGVCDVAENCTGISAGCPADAKSSAQCRASAGVCDTPESCDGLTDACPADSFLPASTTCRGASGECDVAENCSGSGASCPSDGVAAGGMACTADSNLCTDDQCDGSSKSCQHPNNSDPCDDGAFCSVGDTCSGGTCSGTARDCSDADACTDDTCNEGTDACDHAPSSAPACVDPQADLSIVKTDVSSPVEAGAFATYSLTVTNDGPNTATAVQVIDDLDPDTTFVTATRPCTEGPVGKLTCDLGDVDSGSTVTFEVVVHVDAAAPTAGTLANSACSGSEDLCNHASVVSPVDDPDPSDNTSEVTTNVVPPVRSSELTMTKEDLETEPILAGDNVTYRITIANSGPDAATDVVIHEDLDPQMTWVSDTAGCTVSDPGTAGGGQRLACALGTIAAGASASFDVVVTVSLAADVDGTDEDGDCGAGSDLCNDAVVTTSAPDFTVSNNRDREPTNVARANTCGNNVLEAGEQCDPPSAEICNNGIDDDADMLTDCASPACAVPGYQSCTASCRLAPACNRIGKDPARITDRRIQIHGNFQPSAPVDPVTDGFQFVVSNANGEVYRGRLLPGDMKRTKVPKGVAYWQFKDSGARHGAGARDGLYRVGIHRRYEKDGGVLYVFRIAAVGDMSAATLAEMTTQVYIGNEVGYATATWKGRPGNWRLSLADFEAQNPQ